MSRKTPESAQEAKQMYANGYTLDEIKDHFCVKSKSTICYWINDVAREKMEESHRLYNQATENKSKKKWHSNNKDWVTQYRKEYRSTLRGKELAKKHHKKYRDDNQEKNQRI